MIKLTLLGNLGHDAIINNVNDSKVISFSVAINQNYTDSKTKEVVERTLWVQCSYWRNRDQSCKIAEYLQQGTKVYLEGVPFVSEYTDRNGEKRASLSMRVDFVEIASFKEKVDVETFPDVNVEQQAQNAIKNDLTKPPADDDLPF